jgi:hypothetical protein
LATLRKLSLTAFERRPGIHAIDTASIEGAARILVAEYDAAISAMVTGFLRKAATRTRDLTSGVAALRDGFAKESRDRAIAIRGRPVAYALDRRKAIAVWREKLSRERSVDSESGEAARRGRGSK